ncbi:MAG: hydrolase TatD [Candidatus Omnitrophica bacterium CG11_big_fil_rev_8_21_14_0_20_63_9]|nr:MAG: hydrolase TatD [Candidatus Omnitrophica bacterium CG11_big_fil_rev_8_21_14_0_20_63_9]
MPPELIDTHCHLDYPPLSDDIAAVLQRARAQGVRQCVTIGTSLERSRAGVLIAQRFPQVRAAVGVHPNDCAHMDDTTWAALDELAAQPEVVAIGEVGLDQYRKTVELARQQEVFRGFLALARRRALPVLIHCRDAYEPLLKLLRERAATWEGIIHCASGPAEFIQGALALGLHISFAGNVTFPNAKALQALVPLVPDHRLLIETDAPFLAPQPVRGQPNEPAHVAHTAAFLAQLRGVSAAALGACTSANARRLFRLSDRESV